MKLIITSFVMLLFSVNVFSQQLNAYFQIATEEPLVVLKATDKLMNSEFGKNFPASVVLYAELFNGKETATHTLGFLFKDAEGMQKAYELWMESKEVAEWNKIVNAVDQDAGNILTTPIVQGASSPLKDMVFMRFTLSVKDEAKYAIAYTKFTKDAINRGIDKGSYGLSSIVAGSNPKMTHFAYIGAPNIPLLLKRVATLKADEGYKMFAQKVAEIRTVEKQDMIMRVKAWNTLK
ncbi:hypothetical protein OAK19_00880 [Aureispira]|nr:hypothetical protein [Aureispira sp.]